MSRRKITYEEMQTLFSLIGQGIWYSQNLEIALSTSILLKGEIKKRGSVAADLAKIMLQKNHDNTLGSSLKKAKRLNVFEATLFERLEKFNAERSWVVHRCVRENADDMYTDELRPVLFKRLDAFSEEASLLQRLIAEDLTHFVTKQGVSREWIDAKSRADVAKMHGEG